MQASKPDVLRISGLQEMAAALWDRQRHIPSQTYLNPLDHIFTEFDLDNDDCLDASDIAAALQSRGVTITPEQVQVGG